MKKFILIIILSLLTGCYNYHELNELAITTGTAVEKENGQYKLTIQIVNTQKQNTSEQTSSQTKFENYSYIDDSIHGAARKILTKMPKRIYSNHLQLLIISEDIAKNNIGEILDFWFREVEIRNDFYVLISDSIPPSQILEIMPQLLPINSIDLNKLLITNSEYLGSTKLLTFDDLIDDYISETKEIVMPFITIEGDVNKGDSKENSESPNPKALLKLNKLGIFKDNKLIDYLDINEGIYYNFIINQLKTTIIDYECDENKYLNIEISDSKTKIKFNKDKNELSLKIKAKAKITACPCDIDLEKESSIKEIKNNIEKKMINEMDKIIKKAQSLETDIFNFRDHFYKYNNSFYKKIDTTYNDFFKALKINIEVDLSVSEKGNGLKVATNENK